MAGQRNKGTAQIQRVRKLDGKVVKAVLFNGKAAGLGKCMAGEVDGVLVVDGNGRPIPLNMIGYLE